MLNMVLLYHVETFLCLFTESSIQILKSDIEEQRICVLEFWSVFLSLSYDNTEKEKVVNFLDITTGNISSYFGE